MKIVDLNTWDGKQKEEITDFIKSQLDDTDIFCFQEVYGEMRSIAQSLLPDFQEVYQYQFGFEHETGVEDYAQAIYIRKDIQIIKSEVLFEDSFESGLGLEIEIKTKEGVLHLFNYHGVSRPKDKLDNEARLNQSQKIIDYFSSLEGRKLLIGDFNFLPTTQSYNLFIKAGYNELIMSNKIPTTRNRLFFDRRPEKHLFSDYIFVTPDIEVKKFEVPNIEISDHLPVILQF